MPKLIFREVIYMRIMAVDYGDQRTGVAFSDPTGTIAGEAFVIKEWDPGRLAEKLADEAGARGARRVILGNPLNMDGSAGPRSEKSRALGELLRERGLEVVMWDERRTTVEAHAILSANDRRGRRRRETVDAVAATLILEGYLGGMGR